MSTEPSASPTSITSGSEFLLLICRTIVGYGVMFTCLLLLLRSPSWTFSAIDAVFWIAFVGVALLDLRAMRAEGTQSSWARTVLVRLPVASSLWLAAQSAQVIK